MNNTNKLCVVGDKLEKFAQHNNVISISSLERMIEGHERKSKNDSHFLIYVGQGVNSKRLSDLYTRILSKGLNNTYEIKEEGTVAKADRVLTHKYKIENSMISIPQELEDGTYLSLLMLDDNCAEMSDHVTGQHLQGMVLIEAARQMTLAVTEQYFLTDAQRGKMYFVTNNLETKFARFIFPLNVKLHYEILKSRGLDSNRYFDVNVTFIQNDEIGTEVRYGFTVMDPGYMVQKEAEQARLNLQQYLL